MFPFCVCAVSVLGVMTTNECMVEKTWLVLIDRPWLVLID